MKQVLKAAFEAAGYLVRNTRSVPRQLLDPANLILLEFDDVVCRHMIETRPDLTFIQVGAYDGEVKDPLRKYISKWNWRGILIEPQSRAVSQLRRIYSHNSNIEIVQAAIDKSNGKRTLFIVDGAGLPDWVGGLASFDRALIEKHALMLPKGLGNICEEVVECLTFDQIIQSLPQDGNIDLLQIDTEGADADILMMFPFERTCPAIIQWEVKHLTKIQREDVMARLKFFRYRFALSGGEDMVAVRQQ